MDNLRQLMAVSFALLITACGQQGDSSQGSDTTPNTTPSEFSVNADGVKTKNVEGFGGVIAERAADAH